MRNVDWGGERQFLKGCCFCALYRSCQLTLMWCIPKETVSFTLYHTHNCTRYEHKHTHTHIRKQNKYVQSTHTLAIALDFVTIGNESNWKWKHSKFNFNKKNQNGETLRPRVWNEIQNTKNTTTTARYSCNISHVASKL